MQNGTKRLARSSNYGKTWREISSSYEVNELYVSPLYANTGEIFAIINNNVVSISYDLGSSWYTRMTGMKGNDRLAGLAFSPNYKLDKTLYAVDKQGQVFISEDNAFTWKSLKVILDNGSQFNNLTVLPGNKLIAGTSDGVYELTEYISPARLVQMVRSVFTPGKATYTIGTDEWYMDTAPYIDSDRTFVPVRYLAYALGMNDSDILWDDTKKEVTLTKDKTEVKISMSSLSLFVNKQPVTMDVLPQIRNGRVFLPARWVAEAFGANVSWDATDNSVIIEYMK